jgi:hypothetical protein
VKISVTNVNHPIGICDSCQHQKATRCVIYPDNATFFVCTDCSVVARLIGRNEAARA